MAPSVALSIKEDDMYVDIGGVQVQKRRPKNFALVPKVCLSVCVRVCVHIYTCVCTHVFV